MEQFSARVELGEVAILHLSGHVDSMTLNQVEKALVNVMASKCYKIVVDLSEADYVSSAGWGLFVGHVKTARANSGDIKFASMKDDVREVYELLDFTNIIEYYKTVESAVKSFPSR